VDDLGGVTDQISLIVGSHCADQAVLNKNRLVVAMLSIAMGQGQQLSSLPRLAASNIY
jgi:hypothetical protein